MKIGKNQKNNQKNRKKRKLESSTGHCHGRWKPELQIKKQFWNMPRKANAAKAAQQAYQSNQQKIEKQYYFFFLNKPAASECLQKYQIKNRNYKQHMDSKEFTSTGQSKS